MHLITDQDGHEKVWLDGVEPGDIKTNRAWGITGATSNPTIVSKIIASGHFNDRFSDLIAQGRDDHQIAWQLNDEQVESAQRVFRVFARVGADHRKLWVRELRIGPAH